MFSIEPKRETIVKFSLTITLDEEGINQFLVDPVWLQKQVRTFRAQHYKRSAWSATGHADGRKATEKNQAASAQHNIAATTPRASSANCAASC